MSEFDHDHNHDQEGRGPSRASCDYRHPATGLRGFETTPYSLDSLVSVRGRVSLRRIAVRIGFATAIFLQLGFAGARAEEFKITIDNFTFTPPELKVKVGDTVTWANHDDIPHTVVSAGKFRSKTLDSDDSFSFTFTAAGDYKYFCGIHPHMTGLIKVE